MKKVKAQLDIPEKLHKEVKIASINKGMKLYPYILKCIEAGNKLLTNKKVA